MYAFKSLRRPPSHLALLLAPVALGLLSHDPSGQCEASVLEASDGEINDRYGIALVLEGTTAAVGACSRSSSGAVYVIDVDTRQELAILTPSDAELFSEFGQALAVDGGRLAVSAPLADATQEFEVGAVYLFDFATGAELGRIDLAGGTFQDRFGASVALGAGVLAVGAPGVDQFDSGAVVLYDPLTLQELRRLKPPPPVFLDGFGTSLALEGSTLLVGSPGSFASGSPAGAAFLYDAGTGLELGTLVAGSAGDELGTSVALDGDLGLVGAPGTSVPGAGAGAAYLFDLATGQVLQTLTPDVPVLASRFGATVALTDGIAYVGAPFEGSAESTSMGAVYLFDVASGQQLQRVEAVTGASGERFGSSIAPDGARAFFGAPYGVSASEVAVGGVYEFDLDCVLLPALSADVTTGPFPLEVQFQDLTVADPPVTTWSWDLGDGTHSTSASPTHAYKLTGTYDVSLTVSNGIGTDAVSQQDFVVVVPGPATVVEENGAGTNPTIFTSTVAPVLGTTWSATIDGASVGATGGLTFVFGSFEPLEPGLLLGVGELLADLSAGAAVLDVSTLVAGSASHSIPVPNDNALAGLCLITQCFVNVSSTGAGQLGNGLLLTFSTF